MRGLAYISRIVAFLALMTGASLISPAFADIGVGGLLSSGEKALSQSPTKTATDSVVYLNKIPGAKAETAKITDFEPRSTAEITKRAQVMREVHKPQFDKLKALKGRISGALSAIKNFSPSGVMSTVKGAVPTSISGAASTAQSVSGSIGGSTGSGISSTVSTGTTIYNKSEDVIKENPNVFTNFK